MKKTILLSFLSIILISSIAEAQYYRMGPRRMRPHVNRYEEHLPKFEPTVNISLGYGYPNLDKYDLGDFYGVYKGDVSQTGPFMGAIDYQFSRQMSIGVMITHGKVTAPYYSAGTTTQVFTGNLDNWAIMLDLVRYLPSGEKVSPYLRTAIGVNVWKQDYIDPLGNKAASAFDPSELAYQVGLGAKFNLTKNAGLFIEAGYGKYILNGGLAFKF